MSSSYLELEDYVEVGCYEEYIDCFDDDSGEDYGYQPYVLEDYSDDAGGYDPIFDRQYCSSLEFAVVASPIYSSMRVYCSFIWLYVLRGLNYEYAPSNASVLV